MPMREPLRSFLCALLCSIAPLLNAQIEQVASFTAGSFGYVPRDLVVMGSHIYFRNWTAESGMELWRTDGTTAGTVLVKDIRPGAGNGMEANEGMAVVGNTLYFPADDGTTGWELWKSDGTEAGTMLVMDIRPGPLGSSPAYLTAFGDRLLFRANNATSEALYSTDGTPGGTYAPVDFVTQQTITVSGPIRPMGAVAVFPGTALSEAGGEIWTTDGTPSGCFLLSDICPGIGWSNAAGRSWMADDFLYFLADDCTHGIELWRTNGTAPTTTLVADVYTGTNSASPYHLVPLDGQVLFAALDDTGNGIYRSDGTAIGTYKLATMGVPQLWNGDRQPARRVGDIALFVGLDPDHGYELWRSDGTEAGTYMVKDLWPGTNGSIAGAGFNFWVFGGQLYFAPEVPVYSTELWRSDGTEAGTVMVQDRAPGINYFAPDHLVQFGDHIYMTGSLTASDRGIYRLELAGTGMAESATTATLRVYPNPTNGNGCTLQLPNGIATQGPLRVELLDATGRVVVQRTLQDAPTLQLELERALNPGVYAVRVHHAQGGLLTAQLVVQ